MDLQGTIKTLRYFAGWADKIHGSSIPTGKVTLATFHAAQTRRDTFSDPFTALKRISSGQMEDFVHLNKQQLPPRGIRGMNMGQEARGDSVELDLSNN